MAIKIAVLGGKGGVGKTTVTANLSYALAGKSLRVAAVDSDTGLNCLNKAFRQPKPLFYLNDVLTGTMQNKAGAFSERNASVLLCFELEGRHVSSRAEYTRAF